MRRSGARCESFSSSAEIIPSSARSTASAASQLPPHLVPILAAPLEIVKAAVDKALPRHKPKSALEEAEFEDEIGDDLQKHMMVQCELSVLLSS